MMYTILSSAAKTASGVCTASGSKRFQSNQKQPSCCKPKSSAKALDANNKERRCAGFFNTEIRHSLEIQREIIYVHHVSSATANYNRLRSFAQPRWSAQRPLPYWLRSL